MSDYKTFGDIFCGGGGFSLGAVAAGLQPLWAIENDPEAAEVYAANLGNHVIVKNVQDIRIGSLERPEVLLASPPCQSHSTARSKKLSSRADAEIGLVVLDYVRILRPRLLIVENVEGWKRSHSFGAIFHGLHELGYWVDVQVINSVNMGVPQTRKRLFLRASLDGFLPSLPAPVKWIGWYSAIEDLIDTLPEGQFADWQLKRLPKELTDFGLLVNHNQSEWQPDGVCYRKSSEPASTVVGSSVGRVRAFLMTVQGENSDYKWGSEPAPTVTASHTAGKHRAFLINNHFGNADCTRVNIRDATNPAHSVTSLNPMRAFLIGGGNTNKEIIDSVARDADTPAFTVATNALRNTRALLIRAWLEQGRVVSMTPRALARFQSVPDDYDLPDKASLACKVLGNMVPPLMAEKLLC